MRCFVLPSVRFDELNGLYEMNAEYSAIRRENQNKLREICIVAEEDGKLVGEINVMTENANIPAAVIPNRRVYLYALRVLPEYRGRGIAKELIGYALKMCASRGIFEFTIGVEKDNETAKQLYRRFGFNEFLENCAEIQDGRECKFDLLMLAV